MILNTDKIFADAVNEQSVNVVENLLQCSDTKCELMKNYSQTNDVENLLCLLCKFKSKGLVQNIETLCTEHDNFKSFLMKSRKNEREKIVLHHSANKKSNEKKHLRESSFKPKNYILQNLTNEPVLKNERLTINV